MTTTTAGRTNSPERQRLPSSWTDGTFAAGAGSVLVTVGAGGHNARTVASPLPAWAATASGTNSPGGIAFGHLEITATPTALTARYVADAGNTAYSDSFVVAR